MLLAILAAAAAAAAEPAPAAPVPPVTVAPATVTPAKKKEPQIICVTERPTGSHRVERVCYDKDVRDQVQDAFDRRRNVGAEGRSGLGAPR